MRTGHPFYLLSPPGPPLWFKPTQGDPFPTPTPLVSSDGSRGSLKGVPQGRRTKKILFTPVCDRYTRDCHSSDGCGYYDPGKILKLGDLSVKIIGGKKKFSSLLNESK